ncbi:MAG: Hpt domain-containing protein, partial [Deltaproteobacteria bacterium]|nr:Hpt domain-containing protein [Deltaproteobacteria bacterium]
NTSFAEQYLSWTVLSPDFNLVAMDMQNNGLKIHTWTNDEPTDRHWTWWPSLGHEKFSNEERDGFFTGEDDYGRMRLNFYRKIFMPDAREPALTLYLSQPLDTAHNKANQVLLRNLIMFFTALLFALLITGFLGYWGFFRPVHTLLRRTKPASGASRSVAGMVTKDFERLAASFDYMDAALEKRSQELMLANNEALVVNRAKSEFLTNMSYGICAPMNSIIDLAHLLLKTQMLPKQQAYLSKIYEAANNLLNIINDILDFSKVESEQITLENVSFQIQTLLENTLAQFDSDAQKKGILISVKIDPLVPPVLFGDPLRLGQVLNNITDNAVKFTEQGKIEINCGLSPRASSTPEGQDKKIDLFISVRDSGIGMSHEQAGKLFQAFTQADGSSTRKFGGTGLGLALTQRLAQMMGGNIHVDSALGVGTTVTLNLTLLVPEDENLEINRLALSFSGLPTLLVATNAQDKNKKPHEENLRELGLLVDVTDNLPAAFALLAQDEQDEKYRRLIFMEISQLPMSLPGVVQSMREDLKLLWIPPILALLQTEENTEEALIEGTAGVVRPSTTRADLIELLTDVFKRFPPPNRGADSKPKIITTANNLKDVDMNNLSTERIQMSQQTSSQTPDSLPPLPELNPEALKRLGNNQKLYRKLLVQFVEFYQDMRGTYQKAVEAGDLTEVTRIAHTLKGLAGSIGADDLFERAKNLELAHKNSGLEQQALADACFDKLLEVQNMLRTALSLGHDSASPAPETPPSSSQISDEDKARAQSALDKLVAFLRDDDGEAAAFFEANRPSLSLLVDNEILHKLQDRLARFEFGDALALLGKN